jgi:peptidyl-dipeptidase A
MNLDQFIEQQRNLVEHREIDSAIAYWEAGMAATPEAEDRAARAQAELDLCYSDPERFEQLRLAPEPDDLDLRRQRQILLDEFARNQMSRDVIEDIARREMEIEGIFSNYRADFGGRKVTDNDIRAILRSSADSAERRQAWEAGKQIGPRISGNLLDLIAIRNREARRCGYENFYSMTVSLQELDEDALFATLESVSQAIEPTFLTEKLGFDRRIAAKFDISPSELRPWHYSDPFFQEAPCPDEDRFDKLFEGRNLEEILVAFYSAIGLEIKGLLPHADLYEKPGKNQHAYCLTVGRGTGDVRVNCNLRSDAKWMGTLLHEFGHAVYDNELDVTLPFFLRTVSHIMTTEAVAELMGRFVSSGAWLSRWAQVPKDEADRIAEIAQKALRLNLLVFTQWVQVITHFERELYRAPNQDLDSLWWDLVSRYQHVALPNTRPAQAWAAKIHLSSSPVYYHNYLYGEMIASQILHYLRANVVANDDDLVGSPKVGGWLVERFFRPGARYMWNDHVAFATGEPLNSRYFIEDLCG